MKRILSYIILISLIGSCGDIEKPKKPENLISKDKMVDIIVEINLLNAAKGINKGVLESYGIKPQEYVFEKFDIDSTQFSQSSRYYAYDLKTYEGIYQKAKERLEERKKAFQIELDDTKKLNDSIKRINLDSVKSKKPIFNKEANFQSPLKKTLTPQ